MANAENAKIQYEGGQNQQALSALGDSGDATTFESGAALWSRWRGAEPEAGAWSFEAEVWRRTGFELPSLWFLPLVRLSWPLRPVCGSSS